MTGLGYVSTTARAVALRVGERTVEGYLGGREIPGPVAKLIETMQALEELRRSLRWAQRKAA